jgi:hypothetical protein
VSDHFMVVCNNCGNLVSQCRCPGYKEIRHVDTCFKCASKPVETAPSASTNSDYAAALENAFWAGCGYGAAGGIHFDLAAKDYVKRLNASTHFA